MSNYVFYDNINKHKKYCLVQYIYHVHAVSQNTFTAIEVR